MNVASPTQKPRVPLTGEISMVAIKPPVPIVDLYIMSCISFNRRQGWVGVCSGQRLRTPRTRPGRSQLRPMPTYGQQFRQGR